MPPLCALLLFLETLKLVLAPLRPAARPFKEGTLQVI